MAVTRTDYLAKNHGVIVSLHQHGREPICGKFDSTVTIDEIWRWAVKAGKGIPGEIRIHLDWGPKGTSKPVGGREQ